MQILRKIFQSSVHCYKHSSKILLILETELLKCTLNKIVGLLMNVTFSNKIEILNYCHTLVVCIVTFALVVNILTNTVMYNKSINLYVQLGVCIFTNLLFFVILCALFDCLEFFYCAFSNTFYSVE